MRPNTNKREDAHKGILYFILPSGVSSPGGCQWAPLRVRRGNGGCVAERSESSNPMIASGNHTDSNNGRPAGSKFIICNL